MADQPGDAANGGSASSRRWTCMACGCNTNTETDAACGICGTSNSGPSALRRQARPNWFPRSVFGRGRGLPEDFGVEDEADLWESVVDDVEMAGGGGAGDQDDRASSAIESLAMEVSGMASAARRSLESRRQGLESGRQRLLDAARSFSQQPDRPQATPEELWEIATQNGTTYGPQWMNPSQMSGRTRSTNGIELVPGQPTQQLAHVPPGAGEGRTIRATQPIPRDNPLSRSSPRRQDTGGSNSSEAGPPPRRAFGFKVAFDHPNTETGGNLGGCYLIGVTVASFTAYGEQNGLSSSGFFWGIEDGGNKYEGARFAQPNRGSRRISSANYAAEVNADDVPMNEANLLFGSREVVTVICDIDARTLTFWRNDTLLGTLVNNLPRTGNLFPVAVPFNTGVAVAITGLDGDPLPILREFSVDARRLQGEKEDVVRQQVVERRQVLYKDGAVTPRLREVLSEIFALYSEHSDEMLSYASSARLFYRCGMNLEFLDSCLEQSGTSGVTFETFFGIMEKVLHEDEACIQKYYASGDLSIKKKDKVELVEGYDKFEDASSGPLKPGDRGTVVEVQIGPNGERRSIRVLYNGRRWWYQPQAIVSERSKLIDSSGVWFLGAVLRAHGFDSTTLENLDGKPVEASTAQDGDVVVPSGKDVSDDPEYGPCIGRVVMDSSSSSSPPPANGDDATISVDYINPSFGTRAGAARSLSSGSTAHIERRKLRVNKLVHATLLLEKTVEKTEEEELDINGSAEDESSDSSGQDTTTDKVRSDLAGVARMEGPALESMLMHLTKKSPDSLAAVFSAGLPGALLSAADVARRQMSSLEPREDLPERLNSLGLLTLFTADQLFSVSPKRYGENDSSDRHADDEAMSGEAGDNVPSRSGQSMGQGQNANNNLRRGSNNVRGLVASIQQRRSFLLSLMSRGGSARQSHMQGLSAMEAASLGGREFALAYGAGPGNPDQDGAGGSWEEPVEGGNDEDTSSDVEPIGQEESSFLDSIRRKRGFVSSKSRARTAGMSQLVFQRRLFELGLLPNSLSWTKALIEDFGSKAAQGRPASLLRHASDEEGKSALHLALFFGCSIEIIKCLIGAGAQVGPEEIRKCVSTNQYDVLSVLLRHGAVPDDVDVEKCSVEIAAVIAGAKRRRDLMDRRMRDSAGSFMVDILRKLMKLALQARRHRSPKLDLCSRVISEILLGNVLLQALQVAQNDSNKAAGEAPASEEDNPETSIENGGLSLMHSAGLLTSLPASVTAQALFTDPENATDFFLVLEDYLCSKEMPYAAAGLTALICALKQFPQLGLSSEIKRYGMMAFAEFHEDLASNRCKEIISHQLAKRSEVSSSNSDGGSSSSSTNECEQLSAGVVVCPQKHPASLHVTRHSSFRCDLCGCGVDRGRPMHGCRKCDWDACEDCTDKAESGFLKCSTIHELALECKKHLAEDPGEEGDIDISVVLADLERNSSVTDVEAVGLSLVEHDFDAVEELARMLRTPGQVTIHQFLDTVLPALHSACLGRSLDSVASRSGHKSKKAKVGMFFGDDKGTSSVSTQFCTEVVNMLILQHGEKEAKLELSGRPEEGGEDEHDEEVENESELMVASNSGPLVSEREVSFYAESSELLRRLQQVLSLYEKVLAAGPSSRKKPTSSSTNNTGADLHVLTAPLELDLLPSSFGETTPCARNRLSVLAEPLLSLSELELHVLRTCVPLDPAYAAFCQSLSGDKAVVLERPKKGDRYWSLAQVVSFDECTGTHGICYASKFSEARSPGPLRLLEGFPDVTNVVDFGSKIVHVTLAAREYVVMHRDKYGKTQSMTRVCPPGQPINRLVGARVECNLGEGGKWKPGTIIKCEGEGSSAVCVVVADDGIAIPDVPITSLRAHGIFGEAVEDDPALSELGGGGRGGPPDALVRAFPFFAARARSDESRESQQTQKSATALKRTWSALSLADALTPFDLNRPASASASKSQPSSFETASFLSKIGDVDVEIISGVGLIEMPPTLEVRFNLHGKLPVEFDRSGNTTLVRALHVINERGQECQDFQASGRQKLYFSVSLVRNGHLSTYPFEKRPPGIEKAVEPIEAVMAGEKMVADWNAANTSKQEPVRRTRQLSTQPQESDDLDPCLCEGLDEVCVQCMEVLDVLAGASGYTSHGRDRHSKGSAFANEDLSKKLVSHLEDPLAVVGGVLPVWCLEAVAFAPRVFTYESRKSLLDSAAFGVSRSTFRQQESKISVSKLRQRMASLRGRAVELVGEAFSGGAEDPTALQLQADELYGMEEALASRVRAMFRAAGWQEHSLEVAKAAVMRENLLGDAAQVMELYATDRRVTKRRLEVRFDGESGFDAASGDEAGVTRGFYADVAEALLSSEIVAGVQCSHLCSEKSSALVTAAAGKSQQMDIEDLGGDGSKLPMWIPDMDSGSQVVIPTPRADERSAPGVFPRPLPKYHPQIDAIKMKFRFMGRLFAAAMRDGFMFPLPLSSAFLKLVQHGGDGSTSERSNELTIVDHSVLTSSDLPRPGFLGGEIYAAEAHICRALDKIDAADLARPENIRKYLELASDKNFARVAFGKTYDCSFDEYFQDKTFVDPLDPAQDENATQLRPKGYTENVTVFNVREWVRLAKKFFLHEGVVAQAEAFRQGVEDFFPSRYLRLFTPEELQHDVCGVGDNVEKWDESAVRKIFKLDGGKGAAEALVAVAAMGGEGGAALSRRFGPSSPTISYLVKALLEGTPKQRRQFLSFVTSVPIVTPGRIEVVPIVSPTGDFLPMRDPGCLPRANTCSRRLYLPKFEDYEAFSSVLWAVVREESKFKGFFEWRG